MSTDGTDQFAAVEIVDARTRVAVLTKLSEVSREVLAGICEKLAPTRARRDMDPLATTSSRLYGF